MNRAYQLFKFLGSLKMAVVVILAMAVISAVGTFYESRYNAEFAQKIVYQSIWMYVVMGFFCMSLIFSAVERLPWKKHHIPFLTVHLGLLIMVLGSLLTQRLGLDGSLSIPIGSKSSLVSISQKDLSMYASTDGDNFTVLYQKEVDFIKNSPDQNPVVIPLEEKEIQIKKFFAFAIPSQRVVETSNESDRPALRFLLKNPNVSFSDWLTLDRPKVERDLGPVVLVFQKDFDKEYFPKKNTIYFFLEGKKVKYKIFKALQDRNWQEGELVLGEAVSTPWMGMELSLLSFYSNARENIEYKEREYPSGKTQSAILLEYAGEEYWLGINSIIKFFTDRAAYILSWGNRQIDLGFSVELKEFLMDKHPGTNRAASYASRVYVEGLGEQIISMNEPLKYKGFTFYQASFQQDETGNPTASILSVNHDPGRFLKYLGSLLVVLGAILLFYFRKQMSKSKKVVS